ncbi:hypothetical protein GSU68_00705 [Rathayibacter sp. VKM Ac-2759]|uniref:hypothetical protein n=1 Tax=Rathayibacter sp. VKM Ac-2759 TaxID=2609252 RepID=UPI001319486C|nr:hypothetical protein [Rathayibacter sp. VKM Ac-2759]QHC65235.1 hypothetical protein GSU68_00705 [Rathayibacter sp. VKM Ac-2759]
MIGLALAVLLGRCGGVGPLPSTVEGSVHGPWSSEVLTACVAEGTAPPDRRTAGRPEPSGERLLRRSGTC